MRPAHHFKHHFTYMTTCTVTGRYYLGMHSTDVLDDGYLGSGELLLRSVRVHGAENHMRTILETCVDREAASLNEAALITEERLQDPLCMNLVPGGAGGCRSDAQRAKISATLTGRKLTPTHLEALRTAHEALKGVLRPVHVRQAISVAKKGVPFTEAHVKAVTEVKLAKRADAVLLHGRILELRRDSMPYKQIVFTLVSIAPTLSIQLIKSIVHSHKAGSCRTCAFHGAT